MFQSRKHVPRGVALPLYSQEDLSKKHCRHSTPPINLVNFSQTHRSKGITVLTAIRATNPSLSDVAPMPARQSPPCHPCGPASCQALIPLTSSIPKLFLSLCLEHFLGPHCSQVELLTWPTSLY